MWWLRAAQDGDGNAANALGALHADRGETQTAERWYRAAHGRGRRQRRVQPRAALRRAGPYRAGRAVVPPCRVRGAPRGRQRARRPAAPGAATPTGAEPWFSKAAEAGSVDAAFNLGILHAGPGEERTALRWYERAAAAGHTEAALQVGIALLRDGDEQGAERHLRCAAGGGSAEARLPAGRRARTRRAPPADRAGLGEPVAARRRPSARSGTSGPPSRGTGVPRCGSACCAAARGDVVDAARWYREAAEAGSRNGAFNLGLLLAREGSEPEAALWWTRAAEAGHGRAALRLALLARPPRGAGGGAAVVRPGGRARVRPRCPSGRPAAGRAPVRS